MCVCVCVQTDKMYSRVHSYRCSDTLRCYVLLFLSVSLCVKGNSLKFAMKYFVSMKRKHTLMYEALM